MDLAHIQMTLSQERDMFAKYHIKSLGLFGSFVRGEQKPKSDIDILVELEDDEIDLFEFIKLRNYLSERLGRKVDLVMKDTLKPHIGKQILNEVVYL